MDQYIQAFFILSASTILLANNIPQLRNTLISYGPRSTPSPSHNASPKPPKPSQVDNLLEKLSTLRVPHSYFSHFYALSTLSSLFWAVQFLTNGALLHQICSTTTTTEDRPTGTTTPSMSIEQIELAWLLFLLHSLRRLLETTLLTKPSYSKMWLGHYLLGLSFYLAMGIAIWIEGAETLLLAKSTSLSTLRFSAPSFRTIISIPILILSSGFQHDAHAYLASLPKYTIPTHPLFQWVVCPHYTAECVIYIALAVLAAPQGSWVNRTVGCGVVFVVVNLGVTAQGVKGWYEGRFPRQGWEGKWRMVPGVW